MEFGLKFIELQRISRKACLGYPVTLKPYSTLSHIFAKPKDPAIKTNNKTHAVYARLKSSSVSLNASLVHG
jgi:hypothetical protein